MAIIATSAITIAYSASPCPDSSAHKATRAAVNRPNGNLCENMPGAYRARPEGGIRRSALGRTAHKLFTAGRYVRHEDTRPRRAQPQPACRSFRLCVARGHLRARRDHATGPRNTDCLRGLGRTRSPYRQSQADRPRTGGRAHHQPRCRLLGRGPKGLSARRHRYRKSLDFISFHLSRRGSFSNDPKTSPNCSVE